MRHWRPIGVGLALALALPPAQAVESGRPGRAADLLQDEPPANPFLADSPWPMTHRNPYNQASSPYPGPTTAREAQPEFLDSEPVPITLAISGKYPDGQRAMWGTTPCEVFKLVDRQGSLHYVDVWPRLLPRRNAVSGAYSLLDRCGRYYVPRGICIDAFGDKDPGELFSPIEIVSSFELPAELQRGDDDEIIGINLTYDGRIVFVTRRGLVGSLSRELDDLVAYRLAEGQEEVSNSVAVDERGGVFVVTDRTMNRLQWSPREAVRLRRTWRVPYSAGGARATGRLGRGSGTTPTLVGTGHQDRLVVIGDGRRLMHLVMYWRDEIPPDWAGLPGRDRRIAAEIPVTFGDDSATQSTTEQSVTVRGYDILVVNNLYGKLRPLARKFARRRLGNDIHMATIYRSNRPGIAPFGVEKFRWQPRQRVVTSVWANPHISCPNGVPTMSAATGLIYCIGQRDSRWTLEAIDWSTGRSVFHQNLSRETKNNSFFAATEIGPGRSVLSGTFGGILRFQPRPRAVAN